MLVPGDTEVCVVERIESNQVLFESPRVMMSTQDFLNAVVLGNATDVLLDEEGVMCVDVADPDHK
jgi:hypothetical protein